MMMLKPTPAAPVSDEARKAPHSLELEQAVLGALMIDDRALDRVIDFLRPQHFFEPLHGEIYETICNFVQSGKPTTPFALKAVFENRPTLADDLSVPQYLGRLVSAATTVHNIQAYGRELYGYAVRRALVVIGEDISAEAFDLAPGLDPNALIEEAEQKLYQIAEHHSQNSKAVSWRQASTKAIEMAAGAYQRGGGLSGLSTGFADLDAKLGGLAPTDLLILAGRPAMGKAQPLDAMVRTTTGWKPMGDIKLGERLKSIDGRQSFVSGVFPQGVKPVYRVTFSDGRSTRCCGEHLWRVYYRDWDAPRILSTDEVREMLRRTRYIKRLWIDMAPASDWGGRRDVNLPIDPWVLGALIGDGGLSSGVRFTTASGQILRQMQARVCENTVIAENGRYTYELSQWGRTFDGTQIIADTRRNLRGLGLMGCRSYEKFIPRQYLDAPPYQRIQLLRGLLDTDGWVEKHGTVRFSTSSAQLAIDVQELARSLGAWCSRKEKTARYIHHGESKVGRTAYVLTICHPNPKTLFSVDYKVDRAFKIENRKMPVFTSIELDGEAECQCISVTHKSRLYFTDDYIVTHNTALATNIGWNVAKSGTPIGFFSLEMSSEQLATRILAEQARIPSERIRRGMIDETEFRKLYDTQQEFAAIPFDIDARGGLKLPQLVASARRMKRQSGLGLLIVDYLQLIGGRQTSGGNRVQEITEITVGLKALAKELEVPVIALSQLSRKVEERQDKHPQLSDLRESGSIEQDADVVMFVYREEYYVEQAKPDEETTEYGEWMSKMQRCHGKAEVIISKQRHGPIGTVEMAFEGQFTKFGNLARDYLRSERKGY